MIQCLHNQSTNPGHKKVSVQELCSLFEVSRSGYYDHLRKAERARRQQDQQLGQQMEAVFQASRESYGSPRLVDALHKQGVCCGKNRIRRLMSERGLEAKVKRRRRPRTTKSRHVLPVAPNLLRLATGGGRAQGDQPVLGQ